MMQRFLPVLLIVVAVGIFFAYTNPTYTGAVAAARTEVQSLNGALEAATAFESRESELEEQQQALPADGLARLVAFLPDNVNNIQLILDLDALAARSGVRLSNFNVGSTEEGGAEEGDVDMGGSLALESTESIESLDITVTAEGSYTSFRAFIEAAEKSLRILDLVSINVESATTGVYSYDMTFRIYWLK
ncbi:MAG TPA: hypothetical protein VEA92_03540 [Candidatus Paceibacterota bacterium]|nr:hypothetical protein [Candidatus Paceibacterota bacterium]